MLFRNKQTYFQLYTFVQNEIRLWFNQDLKSYEVFKFINISSFTRSLPVIMLEWKRNYGKRMIVFLLREPIYLRYLRSVTTAMRNVNQLWNALINKGVSGFLELSIWVVLQESWRQRHVQSRNIWKCTFSFPWLLPRANFLILCLARANPLTFSLYYFSYLLLFITPTIKSHDLLLNQVRITSLTMNLNPSISLFYLKVFFILFKFLK